MVGQAAEGLGAHDIGHPGVDELQHLAGEQPALAHLVAVPQVALDQLVHVLKGAGGAEAAFLEGLDHILLARLNVALEELAEFLFGPQPAVDVHIHFPVEDLEDHEVGEAGDHRLRPFGEEEVLQVVVAQGGEFHVDLPHHPHFHLLLAGHWDGFKIRQNGVEIFPHLLAAHAFSRLEAVDELLLPAVQHPVGIAGGEFVGPHLVGGVDQQVAVEHGVDHLPHQGEGEGEAGVFLQPGQVYGDDGDEGQPRLFQRLAQQVDVVGRPAAAPGLGDEQGHLVGVVAPVLDGVDELADDQQGGVTGVVVDVFQALVHDAPVVGGEHIHLVALQDEQLLEHAEVDGQHLGHEDGVFLLHLAGEEQPPVLIVFQFCHEKTPFEGKISRGKASRASLLRGSCQGSAGGPGRGRCPSQPARRGCASGQAPG